MVICVTYSYTRDKVLTDSSIYSRAFFVLAVRSCYRRRKGRNKAPIRLLINDESTRTYITKQDLLLANSVDHQKNENFFIQGASESLTRREDVKKAIEDNLSKNKPLSLYPKRHIIFNGEKNLSRPIHWRP